MSNRRQWFVTGGVAAVAVLAAALAINYAGGRVKPVGPGSKAPEFNAVTVPTPPAAGEARHASSYRGKVVFLNMWATWCGPCREEMPRIESLKKEFGPQGLTVLGVSVDNAGMEQPIRDFVKEVGITFDIVYEASGRIRDDYQTVGVPETFIIDREGIIRRRLIGSSWTVDDQRALIRELLAEPATKD